MDEPAPSGIDRRQPGLDRRLSREGRRQGPFRGGRRASDLLLAAALAGGMAASAEASQRPTAIGSARLGRRATDLVRVAAVPDPGKGSPRVVDLAPMRFGVDAASAARVGKAGLPVSFGSLWAGPWNQKLGWGDVEQHLGEARKSGVVPVVNWWYWGDDISPQAVENGVMDRYHHVRKDRATWTRLSTELASRIQKQMGGREAIVVLEPEFNKNGIESYEPFDGYLADEIAVFHAAGVKVVLGFGNWGRESWSRFFRAVAASDYLGIQLLQSSVRDAGSYTSATDALVAAARTLRARFDKPSLVTDLALSSYGPGYEEKQAAVVSDLFHRLTELKVAGVEGLVWRSVADDPKFDTANYHGEAERHWGLLRADGSAKPAYAAFLRGARDESAARVVAVVLPAAGARGGTP